MTDSTNHETNVIRPTRIIGIAVVVTAAVVGTVAAMVMATEIFLILFLAVLFGVFLNRCSAFVQRKTGVSYSWCLGGVTLILTSSIVGGGLFFGAQVNEQLSGAGKRLDEARGKLQSMVEDSPALKSVLSSTPFLRDIVSADSESTKETSNSKTVNMKTSANATNGDDSHREDTAEAASAGSGAISTAAQTAASAITRIFQTTFGLLVNSVLIFFVGLFLATSPQSYRDGVVVLFPKERRDRVTETMNRMGDSLWNWLVGRFGSMLVTGVGASLILFSLGVPMAITAGVVTSLLTFIPNIGGLLALTLAMLLALPEGIVTVQLVFVGYMVLQLIESYVVTPLIQQKQVSLPPALLISFQAVMGVLFGFLGAAVASPLLAAAKTGIELVYIEDVLGDRE